MSFWTRPPVPPILECRIIMPRPALDILKFGNSILLPSTPTFGKKNRLVGLLFSPVQNILTIAMPLANAETWYIYI
jgi:hypothetical protein